MADADEAQERGFARYLKKNPGATFAQYYVASAVEKINRGREMTTLGPRLKPRGPEGADADTADFELAGKRTFQRYATLADLKPEHRVVDYGCGSLRVGVHFIRLLDAGHYFGLDVMRDFIDIGEKLIGPELLAEKTPRFAAISDASVTEAVALGADVVISNAVSYHVHPTETDIYYGNLAKLAGKSGAVLLFNVMLADEPVQYNPTGFAWPLEFYKAQLKQFDFIGTHGGAKVTDKKRAAAGDLKSVTLEFRKP